MVGAEIQERIRKKMDHRGIDPLAIESFLDMVRRIPENDPGYVALHRTCPPDSDSIFDSDKLSTEINELGKRGQSLLSKAIIIKLNGGRSTTMGGVVPKGILTAKNGRSYLDIIVCQAQALRSKWDADIPLLLMNSFFTQESTLESIRGYDPPPETFLQHQVPRLVEHTYAPLDTGTESDWAPPGHGDIYASLKRQGILDRLRSKGTRWAFVSNIDNLAATLEPWILGLMDRDRIDFLLEVTDRTPADRKGGTLIVRDGLLDLLEIAQVSPKDRDCFMDMDRFKVFNTNNVWIDLDALARALDTGGLNLPLIQNHKTVSDVSVIQLETAMGAAIGSFPRGRGLRVGRDRFFPTKKVADLFRLQSDACVLDEMHRLQMNPQRPVSLPPRPRVHFSADFLENPLDIPKRFEDSESVSLLEAVSLEVSGSVFFERNVKIGGRVIVSPPPGETYLVPSGSVLKDRKYP
ncbi:MAG TPA: UTP--glucose-1-phosphate uridylyltransferase [Desulfomonilaceae bacterium]|nr:UTP--glucose-1-phosphate uridylyltransferase [Desulfomonilaceae bacterium]